ncbi:MAG TPA: hypothetical protein VJV04_15600 [Nitrospiraceae bacterium]|nr:hypothetical protein [Nitrospiraceae bacterium]
MAQDPAPAIETRATVHWYEPAVLLLSAGWLMIVQFVEWPALTHGTFDGWHYDSAVFALIGKLLREGGTPYLSYWDHKPPLIHFINAVGLTLSGGRVWGIWMVSAAAWISAAVIGYVALRKAFGILPAVLGIVYFAFGVHAEHGEISNLTEQYALPLQWAALWIFLSLYRTGLEGNYLRQGFWIGGIAATCSFLRPNLIGAAVTMWIVATIVLLRNRQGRMWAKFLVGALVGAATVTIPLLGYLAMQGSLAAFWDQVFHYSALYSSSNWKLRVRAMFAGLKVSTLYAPLALGVAGWLLSVVRLRRSAMTDPKWPVYAVAITWLPIELLFASISGRDYGHYFLPVLVPLSFLTAAFAAEFDTGYLRATVHTLSGRQGLIVFSLAAAIILQPITDIFWKVKEKGLPTSPSDATIPVIDYVRTHSNPEDRIFVWGHATPIYFFSNRKPASQYLYILPLLTPAYADSTVVSRFLADLRHAPPVMIIDASSQDEFSPPLNPWNTGWQFPDATRRHAYWNGESWYSIPPAMKAFHDFVMSEYRHVATIGPRGFAIYRRIES